MGPGGYHYHFDGNCMHWHNETNEDSDYEFSKVDNSTHSPIIGFAFDGYPIYGSYGYVNGNVTLMRSNYVLVKKTAEWDTMGLTITNIAWIMGHLDACNGRFSATPSSLMEFTTTIQQCLSSEIVLMQTMHFHTS